MFSDREAAEKLQWLARVNYAAFYTIVDRSDNACGVRLNCPDVFFIKAEKPIPPVLGRTVFHSVTC